MKKIILSFMAIAAMATGANAQAIAPEAGINISNFLGFSNGQPLNTDIQNGIRIGGVLQSPTWHNICIERGLFYVMNGYRETVGNNILSVHISTIELPLTVQFKARENAAGDRLFVGIGPYLAFNFSGKSKIVGGAADQANFLKIGSDNTDDLKTVDFGGGVNAGYEISNGVFIRAHAQVGFINLKPYGDANNAIYNTNFGLTVGYLLRPKCKCHDKDKDKDKMHGRMMW